MERENPLKYAEMCLEQNCDQIDGIINNVPPQPVQSDPGIRPSARDALRRCQEAPDRPILSSPPGRQDGMPER